MKVNGKPAKSGTIVMMKNDTAAIDTPDGEFGIRFNNTPHDHLEFDQATKAFVFDGFVSEIGVVAGLTLNTINGPAFHFRFAVYTVGSDSKMMRVVHYTVHHA